MNTIKIPTILAIVFIVGVISTLTLVTRFTSLSVQADIGKIPRDVVFTSTTDTNITITWQTEKPTRGVVFVTQKDSKTSFTFYDERAENSTDQLFTTHSVIARGLTPQTSYSFQILQDEQQKKSEKVYEASTGPKLDLNAVQLGPAYGSVLTPEGKPADGALVFITLPGSQTLSSIVKPSGSFLIPLNLIRTEDLSTYLKAEEERVPMTITVKSGNLIATATSDTLNDSPVPEMILGKTYDFRGSQAKNNQEKSTASNIDSPPISTVLGTTSEIATTSFKLLTPKDDSTVTSFYPLISGKGIPDKRVTITFGTTNPQVNTTIVQKDGMWNFSPKIPLGIGKQSVTVSSTDNDNKLIAVTHLFEVMKSGTQVLGDATPSAIPTIRVPTLIPTIATPSPIVTDAITPTDTIPIPGTTYPTIGILSVGAIIFLLGTVLLLK